MKRRRSAEIQAGAAVHVSLTGASAVAGRSRSGATAEGSRQSPRGAAPHLSESDPPLGPVRGARCCAPTHAGPAPRVRAAGHGRLGRPRPRDLAPARAAVGDDSAARTGHVQSAPRPVTRCFHAAGPAKAMRLATWRACSRRCRDCASTRPGGWGFRHGRGASGGPEGVAASVILACLAGRARCGGQVAVPEQVPVVLASRACPFGRARRMTSLRVGAGVGGVRASYPPVIGPC